MSDLSLMWMRALVFCLFIYPQSALADVALPQVGWVVVTRPVLACGGPGDDSEIRDRLLDAFAHPRADGSLPEDCALLEVGATYLLDSQAGAEDHVAVKMWQRNCTRECSPWMSVYFAPARQLVGAYLRPTKPPKE